MNYYEAVKEQNPLAVYPTGYKPAIIGMALRGPNTVFVLSRDACVQHLALEMPIEEADEYFEYNIEAAWMGEHTPYFI